MNKDRFVAGVRDCVHWVLGTQLTNHETALVHQACGMGMDELRSTTLAVLSIMASRLVNRTSLLGGTLCKSDCEAAGLPIVAREKSNLELTLEQSLNVVAHRLGTIESQTTETAQ